jgi:hypothetical protein
MFMTSPPSSIARRLSDHQVERDDTVAAVRRNKTPFIRRKMQSFTQWINLRQLNLHG